MYTQTLRHLNMVAKFDYCDNQTLDQDSIYSIQIFKLRWNWAYFLRLSLFISLCLLWVYVLQSYAFAMHPALNLGIHFIVYFIGIPVFAWISGLINKHTFQLKIGTQQ